MNHESNHRTALSTPNLEPDTGNAVLSKDETPTFHSPVTIRVISYRKLNHDPDGVSVKAVLDGIVALGILTDDSAKQVSEITFESRKSKDERTTIEIEDEL
jgi:Holliday junction resolvase RusA-like endonuclease